MSESHASNHTSGSGRRPPCNSENGPFTLWPPAKGSGCINAMECLFGEAACLTAPGVGRIVFYEDDWQLDRSGNLAARGDRDFSNENCEEYLVLERLRAAFDAALEAATSPSDRRDIVSGMREAVIEAHAVVTGLREGLVRTEQELAAQRRSLNDAERRGQLAAEIEDQETVDVAERFMAKHKDRVDVLEKKLEAQRGEIGLMERELDEMKAQMKKVAGSSSVDSAWREIESAGGTRPETDVKDELLKGEFDRVAREAKAEAQLEALKKRMGR